MSNTLFMYTIYANPRDCPGMFLVRKWQVLPDTKPLALIGPPQHTLDAARALLPAGLVRIIRHPDDDVAIAECWI